MQPSDASYTDYLTDSISSKFTFSYTDVNNVIKVIDSLKAKSSCGNDRISNKLLKTIKYDIAEVLTVIFNQCAAKSVFPSALKIAKIIPLYKKNNEHIKASSLPYCWYCNTGM